MSSQTTGGTNARNYQPDLMSGFKVETNDMGAYFKNAVLGPTGIGTGGGGSFSVGTASGFAALAGTATTITNDGLTISTGNTGETTFTNSTPTGIVYGSGSNTGTTAPYASGLVDAAALYTELKALPGIDISGSASALDAYNAGQGLGVFVPGVYTTASGITVTASKTITLSGAGDYVFVSTGGAITFGATDTIVLTNGATAGRVFWVANNAITTGSTDKLVGNFMSGAASAITIGSTNTINGRLISKATIVVDGTSSTFSLPLGGGGGTTGSTTIAFGVRTQNLLGVAVQPTTLPALTTALRPDGVTLAGNLAFDDGTVPHTTLSSRMYTFLAKVSAVNGAVTLSVVASDDFTKYQPVDVTLNVNLGDGSRAIVGYLYVKNESGAVFIPGTTNLETPGITSLFGDGFGFMSYNASA
jgi:hypothetical protein